MIANDPSTTAKQIAVALDYKSIPGIRKLMKRADMKARVLEIEREASMKGIMTLDERLKLLTDIAKDSEESAANRIKAIESLNKMANRLDPVPINGEGIPTDVIQPVIIQLPDNER